MNHRTGESRHQAALFPVMLDELVGADSLVRVVDLWVGTLDMKQLGFAKAQPQQRGAPAYDPADLLRLYIWGYLSAVRSSRSLERECHRNVECMWLLGRLAPDHKTIAEFRRCNMAALVATCAAFVQFARAHKLIAGVAVAIDGTKLRAVASRKAVKNEQQLQEQARRNSEEIATYLRLLDGQDSQEQPGCERKDVRAALKALHQKASAIQDQVQQLAAGGAIVTVCGEADARLMKGLHAAPGYNLQTAVDSKAHLIVHHNVTNDANDLSQLQPMAEAVVKVLQQQCTVVADTGYANGQHIAALDAKGIVGYVGVGPTVNPTGLLDKTAFTYDAHADCYTCPTGKLLKRWKARKNSIIYEAKRSDCGACAMKLRCTKGVQRSITRSLYEDAMAANEQRVNEHPEMMRLRAAVVEHPFGTLKHHILTSGRLLMRGFAGATSEASLAVLAYNMKRVFNMQGGTWLLQVLRA